MAAILAAVFPATPIAAADPSPAIYIYEAHAYRSLNQVGDLFIYVRYELPLEDGVGGDAWCAELTDPDGCADDPPAPAEPTSLPADLVKLSFYTNGASGDVEDSARVPRIDHALSGIYFGPGHGFAWEDADIRFCVESSAAHFSPPAKTCIGPRWEAGAAAGPVSTARDALADDLIQSLLNLQYERVMALGTLVSNAGKITLAGRVFANEAFPIMDRVVADAFQTGGAALLTAGYTPVAGDSPLQAAIDSTGQASTVASALETVGTHYFGISGTTLLLGGVLVAGFACAGVVYSSTRSPVLASFGFFFPLLVGSWLRAPTMAVIFTLIAILIIPTSAMFIRRTPQ